MTRGISLALALLSLMLLAPIATAQSIRFDAPLDPGESMSYRIEGTSAFEIEAPFLPGGGQDETFTHTLDFDLRVIRADANGARLEMRVTAVRVSSSSSLEGEGSYEAGSADDSSLGRRYAGAFGNAANGIYTILIDADRTITAVQAPDGVLQGMSRDERSAYERVLGSDRLREALQPVLRPPGAPDVAKTDDGWEHSYTERTALGQLTFTTRHTVGTIDDDRAECAMTGDIRINAEGMGRNLEVERDDLTGTLVWDTALGMAREVRSDVDLRYSLSKTPPIRAQVTSSDRVMRTNGGSDDQPHDQPDDLARLLEQACARFDQPAIAAAVVSPERVLAIGVAGVRVQGGDSAVTLEDRWHVGSCTKMMTGTVLARALNDTTRLGLRTELVHFFPDFADQIHPRYKNATVADLLAHTAGVPELTNGMAPDRVALNDLPDDPRKARAAFAQRVLTASNDDAYAPVNAAPAFVYSNAGFGIAAAIAEDLTGQTWEALLDRDIFRPLGMDGAGVGWPASVNAERQPRGHYPGLMSVLAQPVDDAYQLRAAIDPAGDVHATIGGWASFAQDRLRALTGGDSEVLDAGTTLALVTPAEGATYAGGFIVADTPDLGRLYAHDGSAGTFYASLWLLPERDLGVLIVTNAGTGAEACEAVRGRLLERYLEGG